MGGEKKLREKLCREQAKYVFTCSIKKKKKGPKILNNI